MVFWIIARILSNLGLFEVTTCLLSSVTITKYTKYILETITASPFWPCLRIHHAAGKKTSAVFNLVRYLSRSIITAIFVIVTKHSFPLANILQLPQRGNPDWLLGLKTIANLEPRIICNSLDKRYGTNNTRFERSSCKNIFLLSVSQICTYRYIFQDSTPQIFYAHFSLPSCVLYVLFFSSSIAVLYV